MPMASCNRGGNTCGKDSNPGGFSERHRMAVGPGGGPGAELPGPPDAGKRGTHADHQQADHQQAHDQQAEFTPTG